MLPSFSLWGVEINTFPLVIFAAVVVCAVVFMFSRKYEAFCHATVLKMCLPIFISAAVGARLFSAITLMATSGRSFLYNLLFGGAVFYGGLIGGTAGLLIACVVKRYEFLAFSDLFVTILPIGHAIGRLGCYLNGCCYGCRYDGIFAVDYIVDGVFTMVFPTWFVEAGFCCTLFLYFQFLHKNNAIGVRTGIYFTAYSVYRFLIEFVRGDEIRGSIGALSSSQIISIFLFLVGLFVLYKSFKNKRENYLFCEEEEKDAVQSISV